MSFLSIYSSKNRPAILAWFFLLFFFEICVGGSGRIFEFGPLTLRKLNFTVAIFISLFLIAYFKKIEKYIVVILAGFLFSCIVPTLIGFINYGNDWRVSENFLMQSFFILLPFYGFFITNVENIESIIKILKFASMLMAIVYMVLLLLIYIKIIDFLSIYAILIRSSDIMGRGENAFWFKGFLYLCIGLYFFDIEQNLFAKRLKQLIVIIAIYFTFTRGFILALFSTGFLFQLLFKSFFKSALIGLFFIVIVNLFNDYYISASFDRSDSDNVRELQIQQVISAMDPISVIFGHGFGKGVAVRDNHMEIVYLEIFHKQGIIGILFWLSILIYLCFLYSNCKKRGYERKARPFILASFFVYLQSATNPFLTNSIGMNVIMFSLVSLNIYVNEASKKVVIKNATILEA